MNIELEETELEILRDALKSHVSIVVCEGRLKGLALIAGMPDGISDSVRQTVMNESDKEADKKELERKNKVFHVARKINEVLSRVSEFKS